MVAGLLVLVAYHTLRIQSGAIGVGGWTFFSTSHLVWRAVGFWTIARSHNLPQYQEMAGQKLGKCQRIAQSSFWVSLALHSVLLVMWPLVSCHFWTDCSPSDANSQPQELKSFARGLQQWHLHRRSGGQGQHHRERRWPVEVGLLCLVGTENKMAAELDELPSEAVHFFWK